MEQFPQMSTEDIILQMRNVMQIQLAERHGETLEEFIEKHSEKFASVVKAHPEVFEVFASDPETVLSELEEVIFH